MFGSPYDGSTLAGIDDQRAPGDGLSAIIIDRDRMPTGFPDVLWQEQAQRLRRYWDWFTGVTLAQERGKTEKGDKIYKYPLQINPIRHFSRKMASLLFGEVPDNPSTLVKTVITPRQSLVRSKGTEATPDDSAKDEAAFCEAIVREVWDQSNPNALLMENATLSQFLGGCYFQVEHVPQRKDLNIPIVIRGIKPDFVLPIWNPDDLYDLNECFVVYRISAATASAQYGVPLSGNPWVIYCEHWTKRTFSITLDGKPLIARYQSPYGPTQISYTNQANPYGFVPILYFPRLREGTFWGPSLVPDLEGLARELNGRLADIGDLLRKTARPKWFGRNITQNPKQKQFDNGSWYADLGNETGAFKNPPEIWQEDPPAWSDAMNKFNETLNNQLMFSGSLSPILLGLDDSSQRSSLSLQLKMMPATQMARSQRLHWDDGLNRMVKYILWMCAAKGIKIEGKVIARDVVKRLDIKQQWLPMVPLDRKTLVDEVVILKQTNLRSPELALTMLGDVPDLEEELARITASMENEARIETDAEIKKQKAAVQFAAPSATTKADP